MKVAICVLTCRRPELLRRTLTSIAGLRVPGAPTSTSLVVIDNDPDETARTVVEDAAAALPIPVIFAVERRLGIAAARNRAIRVAGEVDFVAFIDDDETVEPGWLIQLLAVQASCHADAVNGPVLSAFATPPPRWMEKGFFFQRLRYPTGTTVRHFGTGNLLLRVSTVRRVPGPFDERFGLSGGSDAHLSKVLLRQGAKIVWANAAVATEHIPAERMRLGWLLKRKYWEANAESRSARILRRHALWWVFSLAAASLRMAVAVVMFVPSIVLGPAASAHTVLLFSRGLGILTGTLGRGSVQYHQRHLQRQRFDRPITDSRAHPSLTSTPLWPRETVNDAPR